MNNYLKNSFIALLCAVSLLGCIKPAQAQTSAKSITSLDVSKLTPEQKTELLGKVSQYQAEQTSPSNISATVRDEASKWGELGANMGRATVAAAKEVGLAANDFAQTPLGKITIAIVVYKVVGSSIIHLFAGSIILFTGLGFAAYFIFKKKYFKVEYEHYPFFKGLYVRKVVKESSIDSDLVIANYISAGVSAALGILIGLFVTFN